MFKEIVFIALLIFVAWLLIFQLLVPFIQGQPFFPFFRSKAIRNLEAEIADARQEIEVENLGKVLSSMKPPAPPMVPDQTQEIK